jgi:hypothetical protein
VEPQTHENADEGEDRKNGDVAENREQAGASAWFHGAKLQKWAVYGWCVTKRPPELIIRSKQYQRKGFVYISGVLADLPGGLV